MLAAPAGSQETPTPLLPDLIQEIPYQLTVTDAGPRVRDRFRLGFRSAVRNVGAGPLEVDGSRASTSEPNMVARQVVQMSDGTARTIPNIGTMFFYVPHDHFHYRGFDRYELHDARTNHRVARDRKSGFCLGDRYRVPLPHGGQRGEGHWGPLTNECQKGDPTALDVTEGISVGWADDYPAQLEGQFIDVTHVPAGRYQLVHRVNVDHSIHEQYYDDNVSSSLIELKWPHGRHAVPTAHLIAGCAGVAICRHRKGQARFSSAARAPGVSALQFADPNAGASAHWFCVPPAPVPEPRRAARPR